MLDILITATLLFASTDCTGEGATWLKERQELLWVDINAGTLHRYNPADGKVEDNQLPEMITSIIPVKGKLDDVVLAMKNRLVVIISKNTPIIIWQKWIHEVHSGVPMTVSAPHMVPYGVGSCA